MGLVQRVAKFQAANAMTLENLDTLLNRAQSEGFSHKARVTMSIEKSFPLDMVYLEVAEDEA